VLGPVKPRLLPNDSNDGDEQIHIAKPEELICSTTDSACGAVALFQSRISQCDHGRFGG
jgi:hypothetical protein